MAVHVIEPTATMTISAEERAFFTTPSERIASLRKANNVTQVQLAEALGVSQQTLQSYEVGRRRIPMSALPVVASTLSVSLDELFGSEHKAARSKARAGFTMAAADGSGRPVAQGPAALRERDAANGAGPSRQPLKE